MFKKELMIAGLRKEQNTLKELIEELEDKPRLEREELKYCEEVLKKVESTLKRLRRPAQHYTSFVL